MNDTVKKGGRPRKIVVEPPTGPLKPSTLTQISARRAEVVARVQRMRIDGLPVNAPSNMPSINPNEPVQPYVKRGPGRPRKYLVEPDAPAVIVKRRPGRPSKYKGEPARHFIWGVRDCITPYHWLMIGVGTKAQIIEKYAQMVHQICNPHHMTPGLEVFTIMFQKYGKNTTVQQLGSYGTIEQALGNMETFAYQFKGVTTKLCTNRLG